MNILKSTIVASAAACVAPPMADAAAKAAIVDFRMFIEFLPFLIPLCQFQAVARHGMSGGAPARASAP